MSNLSPKIRIAINLNDSGDSREFLYNEEDQTLQIIHIDEFKRLKNWIDMRMQSLNNVSKLSMHSTPQRYHNTYTILGKRGGGKSSFLLSILNHYKKLNTDCFVLPIIDPTLIEEKGHIFLNVISLIQKEVNNRIDQIESESGDELNFGLRKEWNEIIFKLAYGMPMIDGVGGNLADVKWQDPEYIMQKGLQAVGAAKDLESNFIKVIEKALSILGKKAIIVAFDDTDIDFKRGWPVLEMIRKYFTSSRLITIISGDLPLLQMAIRKQHWENFGKALLINEGDKQNRMSFYNDKVTEMGAQYLQKMLKPEYRIQLTTLYDKTHGTDKTYIVNGSKSKNVEIKEFYSNALMHYGISNPYQAEPYRSHLLSLPLRTQIRLMNVFDTEDYENANIAAPFVSDLYEKEVNLDIAMSNPVFLNVEILNLLIRNKMLNEAYQLQTTTNDESLNNCLLTMNIIFAQQTLKGNAHLIFDYFIKIGYIRNLMGALDYQNEIQADNQPSIQGLSKYSQLTQDKVMRDIVGLITAYIKGVLEKVGNNNEMWGGMIELKGLAAKDKTKESSDRLDRVFGSANSMERILGYIPASECMYSTKNQSNLMYSFYNLIGCIGDLVLRRQIKGAGLSAGLIELSQIRSYLMPDFTRGILQQYRSPGEVPMDESNKYTADIKLLQDAVENWIDSFPIKRPISPQTLGKISTRVFYAFENIRSSENSKTRLGESFRRLVVAFMNAVLIEDIKENLVYVEGLNINNTNESPKIFIDNLSKLSNESIKQLSFSQWILSCPLLSCYLQKDDPVKEHLFEYTESIHHNPLTISVYDLLNKVSKKSGLKSKVNSTDFDQNIYDYSALYQFLAKEKILSIELFKDYQALDRTFKNNKQIRSILPLHGYDLERLTSTYLRKFRLYLNKNKLRW